MNILAQLGIKIARDNKLKPLKGNSIWLYRSVDPKSIAKLQEFGANVFLVNNPPVENMVDEVLKQAGFAQAERNNLKKVG